MSRTTSPHPTASTTLGQLDSRASPIACAVRQVVSRALGRAALMSVLLAAGPAAAAAEPEIAQLRSLLVQATSQYERRIADLEARLARAERAVGERHRSAGAASRSGGKGADTMGSSRSLKMSAPPAPDTPAQASPDARGQAQDRGGVLSAINPEIEVILDGNYYQDGKNGNGSILVGEAFQPSRPYGPVEAVAAVDPSAIDFHGIATNGFNFRAADIEFAASVDQYLDARLLMSVDGHGTVDLEEAWVQTRRLPYGLRIKAGKFLSDFGYVNRQHPHAWDFVDQNLPYLNLLGEHGLQDTGVQLTWQPRVPFHAVIGGEVAQGDQTVLGATLDAADQRSLGLGRTSGGPRLWTAFAKIGPNLGRRHDLKTGLSYAYNRQHQEFHALTDLSFPGHWSPGWELAAANAAVPGTSLAGDARLWGAELIYQYLAEGADGRGDFKLQAEYLRSIKDLTVRQGVTPGLVGRRPTFITDGLYTQALYGLAPRWTAGLRYDILGLTNEVSGAGVSASFGSSDRWTLDLTWRLSDKSKLRAQYARNTILVEPGRRERFDAFYLQFLVEMGGHG